jgi:hypothetical protein
MRSRLSSYLRWEPAPPVTPPAERDLAAGPSARAVPDAAHEAPELPAAMEAEPGGIAPEPMGHDPALAPRDEAIYLLHTAAEVEHALLVQYLYAAYSLKSQDEVDNPEQKKLLAAWGRGDNGIIEIAREEMAHLASVQNLLHLLGGPLTFEREDFPFHNDLYPFMFRLEPLTKSSLAKYVFAEMPDGLTSDDILSENDVREIMILAKAANQQQRVNHVGALYRLIRARIEELSNGAPDEFRSETVSFQTSSSNWGQEGNEDFILRKVTSGADAISLIDDIAQQGEGAMSPPGATESHYRRFAKIYKAWPAETDWIPARQVAENPNTFQDPPAVEMPAGVSLTATATKPGVEQQMESLEEAMLAEGRITNQRSRLWAQLFNLRYRILLAELSHIFHRQDPILPVTNDLQTPRGKLRDWALETMTADLSTIASILVTLPLKKGAAEGPPYAGPPFELDYTVTLPDREADRWRLHRDLITASRMLIDALKQQEPDEDNKSHLDGLNARDAARLKEIAPLILAYRIAEKEE